MKNIFWLIASLGMFLLFLTSLPFPAQAQTYCNVHKCGECQGEDRCTGQCYERRCDSKTGECVSITACCSWPPSGVCCAPACAPGETPPPKEPYVPTTDPNADPRCANACGYTGCGCGGEPKEKCVPKCKDYQRCDHQHGCWTETDCSGCGSGRRQPPPPPPPPPPSCTISLPETASLPAGADQTMLASVSVSNGSATRVDFSSSDPSIATVTTPDTSSPFTTMIDAITPNRSTTITAVAKVEGPGGSTTCQDTSSVSVTSPVAWWQVKDGDVYSGGNIASLIPRTCSLPVCNPVFSLDGDGGYPGVVIYAGSQYDFKSGESKGRVSSRGWLANTSYQGSSNYTYAFFARQIPSDVVINEIALPSVTGGYFNSGTSSPRGYTWFRRQGDLTISGGDLNLTGSRKVILLVKGGNLNINARININDRGQGFFAAIVGKDASGGKGDILVDPSVSHPTRPELEGIFLADSEFRTGAGSEQLHLRGSVAAWEGISLERDLQDANTNTPAEFFEYAPELILTFPRELTRRPMTWNEVAP